MLKIAGDKITLWGVHVRDIIRDRNLLVSVETTRARARHTAGFWRKTRVVKLECRIVTPIESLDKNTDTKGRPKRQRKPKPKFPPNQMMSEGALKMTTTDCHAQNPNQEPRR